MEVWVLEYDEVLEFCNEHKPAPLNGFNFLMEIALVELNSWQEGYPDQVPIEEQERQKRDPVPMI